MKSSAKPSTNWPSWTQPWPHQYQIYPDLPQIVAFRNQLIHGYATVNVGTVWNIAQNALPTLLDAVQALLDELA